MKNKILPAIFLLALSILFYYSFINKNGSEIPVTQTATAPEINDDWYNTVTRSIIESEYNFREIKDNKYEAVNRRNNMRFSLSPTGFLASERIENIWNVSFELKNIYTGDAKLKLNDNPEILNEEQTLTYQFNSYAIEYLNDASGLRQNFIIEDNESNQSTLKVELQIHSDLQKELLDATKLVIKDNASEKLIYSDLVVYDATGKILPSNMQLQNDLLAIYVDAENAQYPVTIDPLSSVPNWSVEGNQPSANMGFAVSAAGDVNSDGFDDIVIGACAYDAGLTDEGKAFVFLGGSGGVSTTAIWEDEGDNEGGLMGKAVAAAGDVNGDGYDDILIGLGLYDGGPGLDNEGKAHVYYGNDSGVNAEPDWEYESGQENAGLGFPLEGLGDVNADGYADIIIGANGWDNDQEDEGRAYGFYGSVDGLPLTPSWQVEGNSNNAVLGHAVSAAGDINKDGYDDAIVGGWNYSGAVAEAGKAWVYLGSDTGLSTTAVWEKEGDQTGGYFAFWVSGVGDVNKDGYADIMVGAKRYDAGTNDEGKAWLYLGTPTGPSATYSWTQEGNNDEAEYAIQFGPAGDVNGDGIDDVIMGAHFHSETENKEGKCYLYLGSYGGLATTAAWVYYGGVDQANFGWTCDGAGDVNNDGYDDVVIGAFKYSNGESYEGKAFVFHGFNNCTAPPAYTLGTLSSGTASVSWGAVPAASNYKITAKKNAGTYIFYSTTTNFTMTGLTPGKKYKSWVQAHCGATWSLKSNVVSFVLPPMRSGEINSDIELYPNPSHDIIYLGTKNFKELTTDIIIYDVNGKVMKYIMYEKSDNADKIGIDISDLQTGLYFYVLKTADKNYSGNFVKK